MNQKTNLWYLLAALNLVLVFSYLYLVNQVVLNIADREEYRRGTNELVAKVASLESRRRELSSHLTLDFAHSLGFEDATGRTLFARRGAGPAALSYLKNGF